MAATHFALCALLVLPALALPINGTDEWSKLSNGMHKRRNAKLNALVVLDSECEI